MVLGALILPLFGISLGAFFRNTDNTGYSGYSNGYGNGYGNAYERADFTGSGSGSESGQLFTSFSKR